MRFYSCQEVLHRPKACFSPSQKTTGEFLLWVCLGQNPVCHWKDSHSSSAPRVRCQQGISRSGGLDPGMKQPPQLSACGLSNRKHFNAASLPPPPLEFNLKTMTWGFTQGKLVLAAIPPQLSVHWLQWSRLPGPHFPAEKGLGSSIQTTGGCEHPPTTPQQVAVVRMISLYPDTFLGKRILFKWTVYIGVASEYQFPPQSFWFSRTNALPK